MKLLESIVQVLHPHYVTNLLLSITFYILKVTPPFCYTLFEDCELEMREWELMTFLGCVIVMKNRKQPSYMAYLGTIFMFSKLLSMVLFFRQNALLAVIYTIFCLLHVAFLPEPTYSGPKFITYFQGNNFEEEIRNDQRISWVICFYAAWSPTCVNFSPVFAQLSAKYHLDNLKFGKIDINRYTDIAQKFRINHGSMSKQLPTVMLIQNGREVARQPEIDSAGNLVRKFVFTEDTVMREFNLNEVYQQCVKNPIKKKKNKSDLGTPVSTESKEKAE